MNLEIKENLKAAIMAAHSEAEKSVGETREQMETLIEKRMICAALVETMQRKYKHTIKLELAEVMNARDVQRYLTLHKIAPKRDALVDKAQLSLIGLIDPCEPTERAEGNTAPTKTISTIMTRAAREFDKKMKARPVSEWSSGEREQYRRAVMPFLEVLKNLNETK